MHGYRIATHTDSYVFGVTGEWFGVAAERFSVTGERFGVTGERFRVADEWFGVAAEQFCVIDKRFGVADEHLDYLVAKCGRRTKLSRATFASGSQPPFPDA